MAKKAANNSGRKRSSSTGKRTVSAPSATGRNATAKSRSAGASSGTGRRSARASRTAAAHPLTDHDEIRRWAEDRGGVPTCVRGTGGRGDTGMIRLEFPRYGDEPKLQPINWDQWFDKFDERDLALMVQEETSGGEKSNFNKLVKRQTVAAKAKPKFHTAR